MIQIFLNNLVFPSPASNNLNILQTGGTELGNIQNMFSLINQIKVVTIIKISNTFGTKKMRRNDHLVHLGLAHPANQIELVE